MTWAIVGLGWLGSALQKRLSQQHIESWGTHRTLLDLTISELPARQHSVLFLNTPPLLTLPPEVYGTRVAKSPAERVIFVSSTSVYGSTQGAVTEDSAAHPDTASGQWLIAVEEELRGIFRERLLVIRPGGLIGGSRHPAHHLAGRQDIAGGREVVNLIHRTDLISLILRSSADIPVLNAVSPHHPTRSSYYTAWCEKLGLEKPQFKDEANSHRVVDSIYEGLIDWEVPLLDRL